MTPLDAEVLDALKEAGRAVLSRQLTWGASGNISARTAPNTFVISASGTALGDLRRDLLVECDLEGNVLFGTARPSVDRLLHASVYKAREDVGAILHASPLYATLVACSGLEIDSTISTDTAFYLPTVARVAFHPPSSGDLANAVAIAAAKSDAVLLQNHGAVTIGCTPGDVVLRMECLEMLCHMLVVQKMGFPLAPLNIRQVEALTEYLAVDTTPQTGRSALEDA